MTPKIPPERNRRDHILPRGYLEGFTDTGQKDGVLHVFRIEKRSWLKFAISPVRVGAERGYYDYSEDGTPDATADEVFLPFETRFPKIRRDLVANGFSAWTAHRDFLVRYSQMLRARSRLFRQEVLEEANSSVFLNVEEVLTETQLRYSHFEPQGAQRDGLFKNLSITKMREEIKRGAGEFASWHWCLRFTTDITKPIITRDNAVALIGSRPSLRGEAMTNPDTIFVFPICWQACLVGSVRRFDTETEAIHPSMLANLHELYLNQPGCRFAYSPVRLG
jgi:hypothetical protein